MPSKYETDYFQWAMETAAALRAGRFEDVDVMAAAEEIEDLGKSERRSLHSALVQLFLHLLKTRYQPSLAGKSWEVSIKKQRLKISKILEENPSLGPLLSDKTYLAEAYNEAVLDAVLETGLLEDAFPNECPFTRADIQLKDE